METISFALAPRINAAGRVGEALVAARLLLAEDAAEADALAAELEAANLSRRDMTKQAIGEARTSMAVVVDGVETPPPDAPATIARGPWPVGIVGLVASRLVEELGRPAVVGAELGPVIRASCRSDGSLDLGAALEACADLFIRHGGHAGAAGFEIATERWPAFVERFTALAAVAAPRDPRTAVAIDLALPASDDRLRAPSESRPPRAVRSRQSGAARGGPRAGGDPKPRGLGRAHPADAASDGSTSSTGSPSVDPTSRRPSARATASTSSAG